MVYVGDCLEEYYRGYQRGDARSLDYSSIYEGLTGITHWMLPPLTNSKRPVVS